MRTRFNASRHSMLPCLTAVPLAPDDVGEGVPIDPATASFAREGVLFGVSVVHGVVEDVYPSPTWTAEGRAMPTAHDIFGVSVLVHPELSGAEAARLLRLLADQAERAELHRLPHVSRRTSRNSDRDALLGKALLLAEGCHPIAPARLPKPPAGYEYDRNGKLRVAEPDEGYVSEAEEIEEVYDAAE
jgi:hypothetical protein